MRCFGAFSLLNVLFATAACIFSTSARTKVVQTRHVLYILTSELLHSFRHQNLKKFSEDFSFFNIFTSECAFHHSGAQFFNITTYKSALGMRCFVHFHFRMCFSPQRRAIFRHHHLQKCSRNAVFCTFSLPNVLFATAACNFSTSELQKVLRGRQFFNIFTSECAFHHSGAQCFNMSTYKSALGMRCFVHFSLPNVLFATAACNFWFIRWPPDSAPAALTGLLFDWPDTRIIEKTQHFVTSLTFSADVSSFTWLWHYCIFCRLTWLLYCWAMHLLFNSPYCRKFLFKLPSIIMIKNLLHCIFEYLWVVCHAIMSSNMP